ncbi:MAG TPA: hypothetical protein VJJ21_01280 [Candidatus Nanoarchaeia archaeon]|nr:hypothetical protein [Candidatus Nanoarchaeia archaeon]
MQKTDKNLLVLAAENSRYKIKHLSKKLNKSSQRLKYSLKQLEDNALKHPHTIFDYSYFGLILFRVYFKNSFIKESDKKKILGQLKDNQYIVSVYELSGEFDLVIEIIAPNPSRINKELKNLSEFIPSLNNYTLILNIVTHLYPRNYLLQNPQLSAEFEKQLIIGGDRPAIVFNSSELSIMQSLLDSPKARLTALANKTNLNIKTVIVIIKSLQKRKIIRGFKYSLNRNLLGIEKVRLFLKLHNISKEKEEELMDFFMAAKEITQVNKTVGNWDMEIDIESLDKSKIKLLIAQIREQFKDIISNFNRAEFDEYYKKSYLPKHVFSPDRNAIST